MRLAHPSGVPSPRDIVVVDHDCDTREILTCALRSEGYEPFAFESGDDALDYAERTTRPLIVIFGSLRFVEARCARVERLASSALVRVILTTGADPKVIPELPHVDVLRKPLDVNAFFTLLASVHVERLPGMPSPLALARLG